MNDKEYVILVDEKDNELGVMEKLEAHRRGSLHRAFSVLVFNSAGELMIQRRAQGKYHSAGLWTNTCCSHPRKNEPTQQAALRRLEEEMGFTCMLEEKFHFIYRTAFENGLIEHELDFVYAGCFDGKPELNTNEADAWRWIGMNELEKDMEERPLAYTSWFRIILKEYRKRLR